MNIAISESPEKAILALANYIVLQTSQALSVSERFNLVLSGGSSPKKLYALLASPEFKNRIAWPSITFFFGDERNVPASDAESNYRMVRSVLFDPLGIQPNQVFAFDTSKPPKEAALSYTEGLRHYFLAYPGRFDLTLLGLGDNAHTASLFPHTEILHQTTAKTSEVYLLDPPVYRLSFNAPLINQSKHIAFLVYGPEKAAAVAKVLEGKTQVEDYPAQLIRPSDGEITWFLDRDAAALLTNS